MTYKLPVSPLLSLFQVLLLAPLTLLAACSSGVQGELPVATTASQTVSVRVGASSDDAEERADGSVRVTGTHDLELGTEGGKA